MKLKGPERRNQYVRDFEAQSMNHQLALPAPKPTPIELLVNVYLTYFKTLEQKVKKDLTEAEKQVRAQETPEERQRRRNRQKSTNHRRREKEANRLVYGLNSRPADGDAMLSQAMRRMTVEQVWLSEGMTGAVAKGLRALAGLFPAA